MNMAQTTQPEIVHEALDERQYVRTAFPARVTLSTPGKTIQCDILDLSLGGMGLSCRGPLPEGHLYEARLTLELRDASLSLDSRVRVVANRGETTGVAFVDMPQTRRDILRHVIGAYLAGELVETNGILTLMQRENYIRQRKQKADNTRSWSERLRSMLGTSFFLLAGLAILAALSYQLYVYFFRLESTQAIVDTQAFRVTMPENGFVTFLIPEGQTTVKRGEPIAAVSTRLLASLNTPADLAALEDLGDEQVQQLLGRSLIETVISSPCDCEVYYPGPHADRYSYKEESLVHLLPQDSEMHIRASFPPEQIRKLNRTEDVRVQIMGVDGTFGGSIVSARLDEQARQTDVLIRPDQPVPGSAYLSPASVRLYHDAPSPHRLWQSLEALWP